jgi:hypothetical protein
MSRSASADKRITITGRMRAAFRANAAAALQRRSNGYLLGVAMNVLQWLVIGSVALLGLYHWNWQPVHMLVVFVAGVAMAALADLLKWLLSRRRLLADYQKMLDDRLVWNMVTAMQQGRDDIMDNALPKPGAAILMDVVLGGLGIWILLGALRGIGVEPTTLFDATSGLRTALFAVCAAPLISLISSLFAGAREDGGHDDLEFRAGGRGISLLILAGIFSFTSAEADLARQIMVFINGATVFFGVLAVVGVWLMYREREWLRAHLQKAGL